MPAPTDLAAALLRDVRPEIEHLTDNERIRGIARAALTTEADNG